MTSASLNSAARSLATSRKLQHGVAAGIALLAVLARIWIAWRTHATGEDALITLRYAENIGHGRGFVYNLHESVLGVTTPLYTLLLAFFVGLHTDAMMLGKACNIVADGLTCYLLARLPAHKEIGQPVAGLFAAALYAFTSTPISISISGMETGLVTCVGLGMVYAYVAKRAYLLYGLGAILFLLRIDGLLLLLILGAALALRERRLHQRPLALAAILMLPWIFYATSTFGSPIPTSLKAKLTVYAHPTMVAQAHHVTIEAFLDQFVRGGTQKVITLLFLLGAILIVGQAVRRADRGVLLAPLLWVLLYYGIMLFSHVPAFGWYFLPPWPLVIGIATLGAATAPAKLRKMQPALTAAWAGPALLASLAALLFFGLIHLHSVQAEVAHAQEAEDTLRKPMGLWLRTHVRSNERILLEPIGYIGYYSQCRILDMIGLISPEVLPSYTPSIPLPTVDILRRLSPEWLCLRQREADPLRSARGYRLDADYTLIRRFAIPGAEPFLVFERKR